MDGQIMAAPGSGGPGVCVDQQGTQIALFASFERQCFLGPFLLNSPSQFLQNMTFATAGLAMAMAGSPRASKPLHLHSSIVLSMVLLSWLESIRENLMLDDLQDIPARWMTVTIALALASSAPAFAAGQAGANTPELRHTVVLEDLESPWDMAFLDDGTMLFTEKCKGLSVRMPSGEVKALLGMDGSKGYASTAGDLFCDGQAGMMGSPSIRTLPTTAGSMFIRLPESRPRTPTG